VELHRAGDVDGLLALHAADAEFLMPGQEPIRGTAALRDMLEWDAVLGCELIMDAVRAEGDAIIVDSVIQRNKLFQAIGLSEVRHKPGTRIVLRNGLIVGTYPASFDDEIQKRVMEQFEPLLGWLSMHRPDAFELLAGGKSRLDASSAKLWLEVLEEWSNAKQ
jgi:hypothetical protein